METTTETNLPLWTDDGQMHHYTCWNCGSHAAMSLAGSMQFLCACGCGWTNRFGFDPKRERRYWMNRTANLARQYKTRLVDFTKPGALSSPA